MELYLATKRSFTECLMAFLNVDAVAVCYFVIDCSTYYYDSNGASRRCTYPILWQRSLSLRKSMLYYYSCEMYITLDGTEFNLNIKTHTVLHE